MRHPNRLRSGFSLTELVVVIAIIAVLIGILIPTIAGVRNAAKAANTRQQISRIAAACERYRGDFNAYPGPFSNAQVVPSTGGATLTIGATIGANPTIQLTGATFVTQTENMVVGLIGGIGIAPSAPPASTISAGGFFYDANRLGKGPMNLNPLNPKQYPSYIEPGEDELKNVDGSPIPEFIDRFQNEDAPRPILYLRAKTGAPGVVDNTAAATSNVNQYNAFQVGPYFNEFAGGTIQFAAKPNALDNAIPGSYEFFWNSSSGTTATTAAPNQKDGFILMSAGKDGLFGTGDDILSFSR